MTAVNVNGRLSLLISFSNYKVLSITTAIATTTTTTTTTTTNINNNYDNNILCMKVLFWLSGKCEAHVRRSNRACVRSSQSVRSSPCQYLDSIDLNKIL